MPAPPCSFCLRRVYKNSRAVTCDICERWHHINCGNTGISAHEYDAAVENGSDMLFTCNACRDEFPMDTDDTTEVAPQYTLQNQSTLSIPQAESSTISAASEILHEEQMHITTSDSSLIERCDTSDFDITNRHRSFVNEPTESSIMETTITDIPQSTPVTYQIIEKGTERGKPKLVSSDGYSYVVNRQLKYSTDWRCSVRNKTNKCPASVKQMSDSFHGPQSPHSHPARPGIHSAIQKKAEVKFRAQADVFDPAPVIVSNVNNVMNDADLPEASRPSTYALYMIASRARTGLRPSDPVDLDFEIDDDYLHRTTGETFFREMVKVGERRHVILATQTQLDLLEKVKTWYIDGTFKVVKAPFTQLLSIHGFIKSGDNMKQVFKSIVDLIPNHQAEEFVVDFESGLWQGLRQTFDEPRIHGCAFHFSQALYRKVQELGLQTAYNTRDDVYRLLRKTFAIPMIPAGEIGATFRKLKEKSDNTQTDLFFDYVESTWMNSSIWAIEDWCQYSRSIRTNNDCEGWHNKLNKRAKKGNLPFYLMLSLLFTEANDLRMNVRLVREGKLQRAQTKQTKSIQGKIWASWEAYRLGQMTTSELLKKCARLYAPA